MPYLRTSAFICVKNKFYFDNWAVLDSLLFSRTATADKLLSRLSVRVLAHYYFIYILL